MILLTKEQNALLEWVEDFDQNGFATFLIKAGGHRLDRFSSLLTPMPVVAVAFVTWLNQNPRHIDGILTAAIAEYPGHRAMPGLREAASRLAHAQNAQRTAGPPWTASLIGGVPMVNRIPLRVTLERLLAHGNPEIVMVDGPNGTGRSHSWFLINHVARATNNILPIKIDLTAPVLEQRTIETVFDLLVRKLQLARAVRPTTIGATVETIAARYADEIATVLASNPRTSPAWLVFDSLDRPVVPEIKRFICELVQLRLSGELHNCKMFLLGAGRDFGVEDPFRLADLENLSRFLPDEVEATAVAINALGTQPLSAAKLKARITSLTCEMLLLSGRSACKFVSDKLVELRMEVGA